MDTELDPVVISELEACKMQSNVCSPITSLDALHKCLETPPTWTDSIIKLKSRSDYVTKNTFMDCHSEWHSFFPNQRLNKKLVPKTLVCHDMMNGYLEDKYIGRVNLGNGYTFYRWSQIDIFVYFSHHFVTIPPLSWINVSHKNGVPILGTFITEWNQGKAICNHIFKDAQSLKSTADALIEICLLFKLDGWLLNIENEVDQPENLKMFVEYLTNKLHEKQKNSHVIWYDSVTNTGELKWQNELNERNRCYFDACDGIFLNYTWKEDNLDRTVKEAQHRLLDVYVGLDVFGRGCFGGGKFKSHIAAEEVRKRNLSLAVFAPAWTHETLNKEPKQDFLERFHFRDDTLWNGLWPYLYSHPIKYAFETFFQTGVNSEFYDLQAQTPQLTNFLSCDRILEVQDSDLLREQCPCLKGNLQDGMKICRISNVSLPEKTNHVHRLFSTDIFLDGKFIFYCYTKSLNLCNFHLVLLVLNKDQRMMKIVCHAVPTQEEEDYKKNVVKIAPMFNTSNLRKENIPNNWDLRSFEVPFYGETLLEIGISIIEKNPIDLCGFGITIQK